MKVKKGDKIKIGLDNMEKGNTEYYEGIVIIVGDLFGKQHGSIKTDDGPYEDFATNNIIKKIK